MKQYKTKAVELFQNLDHEVKFSSPEHPLLLLALYVSGEFISTSQSGLYQNVLLKK